MGDDAEEAERTRDASHGRNYSEAEWRGFLGEAGLVLEEVRIFDFPIELEPWLARTECAGDAAVRVRQLLSGHIDDGWIALERIALRARPA
jgi:hypothetical protein